MYTHTHMYVRIRERAHDLSSEREAFIRFPIMKYYPTTSRLPRSRGATSRTRDVRCKEDYFANQDRESKRYYVSRRRETIRSQPTLEMNVRIHRRAALRTRHTRYYRPISNSPRLPVDCSTSGMRRSSSVNSTCASPFPPAQLTWRRQRYRKLGRPLDCALLISNMINETPSSESSVVDPTSHIRSGYYDTPWLRIGDSYTRT